MKDKFVQFEANKEEKNLKYTLKQYGFCGVSNPKQFLTSCNTLVEKNIKAKTP